MNALTLLNKSPSRLLITGGTGFIGHHLVTKLLGMGYAMTLFSRQPEAARLAFKNQVLVFSAWEDLPDTTQFEAVINLAGSPVVGPRWTPRRKSILLSSRVGTTQDLVSWLARAQHKPTVLVTGSAIGYYGCCGDEALDESAPPKPEFMSVLCQQWEAAALPAIDLGVRVVRLRLGLVFCSYHQKGGALPKLIAPYFFGLGGRIGDGKQVMSWVHLDDVLAIILRSLTHTQMSGAYNVCAPEAPNQAQFAIAVGQKIHRPTFLVTPACVLNALAGEMGALFTGGQRVQPKKLLDEGYDFLYPNLDGALVAYLNKSF